jgi:hypothetical protein
MEDCNAPNNQIIMLQTPPSPKEGGDHDDDEEKNLKKCKSTKNKRHKTLQQTTK